MDGEVVHDAASLERSCGQRLHCCFLPPLVTSCRKESAQWQVTHSPRRNLAISNGAEMARSSVETARGLTRQGAEERPGHLSTDVVVPTFG